MGTLMAYLTTPVADCQRTNSELKFLSSPNHKPAAAAVLGRSWPVVDLAFNSTHEGGIQSWSKSSQSVVRHDFHASYRRLYSYGANSLNMNDLSTNVVLLPPSGEGREEEGERARASSSVLTICEDQPGPPWCTCARAWALFFVHAFEYNNNF